ncbi:PAK4-inhibitor INKA2 isoform X2 [Pseudophryne corroboree]|uniref:PAK4-inhibitor INKA2 isoform X2 n=1 Tax=Pseudophryne corroboree TaxID=495146 RepID=UPI003081DC5C
MEIVANDSGIRLSMREVGDDLQEQMNCMMGALQELKLLQVQTALEQLEISGDRNQLQNLRANPHCHSARLASEVRHESRKQTEKQWAGGESLDSSSLAGSRRSWAASSLSPVSMPGPTQGHQVLSERERETETRHMSSSANLPPVENWPMHEPQFTTSNFQSHYHVTNANSDHDQCTEEFVCDEANDWTSSLMSQSRNRQPLILGDNIFADLVGNWLDLPEMEKKGEQSENILNVSRSQEIYKKISLTANFFKKFIRSVRPDRDKILKEKPGWLHFEDQKSQISKRTKKTNKQKSVFYFPTQVETKGKVEKPGKSHGKSIEMPTIYAKKDQKQGESMYIGFDMNTAVWV